MTILPPAPNTPAKRCEPRKCILLRPLALPDGALSRERNFSRGCSNSCCGPLGITWLGFAPTRRVALMATCWNEPSERIESS